MSNSYALSFDPRTVPVISMQEVLSPIPIKKLQADFLRQYFQSPPKNWMPEPVQETVFVKTTALIPSAVLIPLVLRTTGISVLFTQRSSTLSKHSGQISFPGGRIDATDANPIAAAQREALEEVGLLPQHIEILGELSPHITGTGFEVHPIVALISASFKTRINHAEVDHIFEVPLSHLMDPSTHRLHEFTQNDRTRRWFSIPSIDLDGNERFIWGATAGMLRNLYRFLAA